MIDETFTFTTPELTFDKSIQTEPDKKLWLNTADGKFYVYDCKIGKWILAMNDPLSTDCPARQMARDFIAKFNQDDGVMRSLHKRNVALSEIVRKAKPALPWISPAIGRWGSHFLRQNFSECAIGDAVPVATDHPEGVETLWIHIHPPGDYDSPEKRRFKKVCCDMVWRGLRNTAYFWERIE